MVTLLKMLVLALSLTVAGHASAQTITVQQADQAVLDIERLIREHYVVSERREPIIAKLEAGRTSGRYSVTRPQDLEERVTTDLQAASGDGHLYLKWNPERYAAATAPSAPGEASARDLAFANSARIANHGIEEVRLLDGNVRYLRLRLFHWVPDVTGRYLDGAMQLLKDGEAVIIDLRGTRGGDGRAVTYLLSHFMPPEETLLMTSGPAGDEFQYRILSYVPSGRFKGQLFVLTDDRSVSAAEAFAYHVRHFRLGTLVGGRTPGSGNNNALLPVAPGFMVSISVYRPRHALTGTNWDGVGIEPDIEVAPSRALQAAYVKALETIAAKAPPDQRRQAQWRLERERIVLDPYPANRRRFPSYVGTYGDRRVWLEGDTLMFEAEGNAESRIAETTLVPFAEDLFSLENSPRLRVRFHRNPAGRTTAIEMLHESATPTRFDRTGGAPSRQASRAPGR